MSKKTGGPAFPLQSIGPDFSPGYSGMTLRDYFATKAMQGTLAGCATRGEVVDWKELAGLSYDVADAMLAERDIEG